MNKKKLLQSKRKGITALVMLVIAVLLVTGVGLLSLGLRSRILAIRNASIAAARCAADAGLTKAIFQMNEKLKAQPWDNNSLPQTANETLPNCDATFSYTATGTEESGYNIESIGISSEAERRVYCNLRLKGPFEGSLFVKQNLTLKSGTTVDGYNSTDSNDTDVKLLVGTNSTESESIVLNSGVTVDGDVVIGVGGDVETVIEDHGAATGDRYALNEEIVYPEITIPTLTDMGPTIKVKGTTIIKGPADSGKYAGIELKHDSSPGILEINGGNVVLHITGDIDLGQDCEIMIDNGSSLVLYLDGDLDAGNSAGINNNNAPTNFKLYGTGEEGQQFDIKAKGDFFGAVYAPNADVVVNAGGDIYGSFMCSSFEMKSGGNFHYDEALRNVSLDDEAVRFIVKYWHE